MSSFFKGYNEIWSYSNKVMNRYEKDILLTIIGYWKNVTENKHYKYLQMSYRYIMNVMGESDPHLIQKYVSKLIDKGLLEIINIEDVINNHHIPKIILKEENINVFFNTDIFNTTGKKQNNPPGTGLSSTPPYKKKESGEAVKKEGAAPPSRQAQLSFIKQNHDNYNNFKQTKEERNGIQEERRNSYAKELAYFWDEL